MRSVFTSAFLLSFFCSLAQSRPLAGPITPAAVDAVVRDLMDKGEVTGLCLGIIRNNKPAYIQAYGFANKPRHSKLDTATSLYAASLAKSLFACLVMQLVDKGRLDLDRPLYLYLPKPLPEYKNYADLAGDERWKQITARHCLSHTTGFANWREFDGASANHKLHIYFTPGQFFSYSGEGIQLLQLAVETITGKDLETLARENIFKPFSMRKTSFVWQPEFEKDYAWGHDMNEDTTPKRRSTAPYAAGSMETTIADYTRFMAALMQGTCMSPKSKQALLSPQIDIKYNSWVFPPVRQDSIAEYQQAGLAYGLGWGLFKSSIGTAFFKEGHLEGWEHYAIGFPAQKTAYIIMTNSSNGESIFKELMEKLSGITIPWKWEGYQPYRATAKLSVAQLQEFTGEYDGKLKAIITLENGQLKVVSPTVNLPKTNFYPSDDHHLFLKIMDANFEFVKGSSGKFEKIIADDEGEHYELKRVK